MTERQEPDLPDRPALKPLVRRGPHLQTQYKLMAESNPQDRWIMSDTVVDPANPKLHDAQY